MSKIKKRLIRLVQQLICFAICYGSYAVPIHGFDILFRQPLDYIHSAYRVSTFFFSALGFLLSLILLWATPKFWSKHYYKAAIMLFYIAFYREACISVAYAYRTLFGNTWTSSEIFASLVSPHWYFYILGFIGVIWHYLAHRLMVLVGNKELASRNSTPIVVD